MSFLDHALLLTCAHAIAAIKACVCVRNFPNRQAVVCVRMIVRIYQIIMRREIFHVNFYVFVFLFAFVFVVMQF